MEHRCRHREGSPFQVGCCGLLLKMLPSESNKQMSVCVHSNIPPLTLSGPRWKAPRRRGGGCNIPPRVGTARHASLLIYQPKLIFNELKISGNFSWHQLQRNCVINFKCKLVKTWQILGPPTITAPSVTTVFKGDTLRLKVIFILSSKPSLIITITNHHHHYRYQDHNQDHFPVHSGRFPGAYDGFLQGFVAEAIDQSGHFYILWTMKFW